MPTGINRRDGFERNRHDVCDDKRDQKSLGEASEDAGQFAFFEKRKRSGAQMRSAYTRCLRRLVGFNGLIQSALQEPPVIQRPVIAIWPTAFVLRLEIVNVIAAIGAPQTLSIACLASVALYLGVSARLGIHGSVRRGQLPLIKDSFVHRV